jgi:AAA15 family ATPase/GTPase
MCPHRLKVAVFELILYIIKMLVQFIVGNYKSIKNKAVLSFEASPDNKDINIHTRKIGNTNVLKLAALYSANASGKTNIINALDFLRDYIVNSFVSLKPNESTNFIPFLFNNREEKQTDISP